ncbi:MAG: potassium-transporting ATPase subunit KdpC [Actinomycetota bacterium]
MISRHILASLRMLLVLSVLLGLAYPLAVTGMAQLTVSHQANGSLVEAGGRVVGSRLIGQRFEGSEWFHSRPDPFDAMASGPTNLGPSNPELASEVGHRVQELEQTEDLAPTAPIPADAVTESGSGLDPDISVAYARLQARRVALARGLPVDRVLALIDRIAQRRILGILGEPRVNVLQLNLALVRLAP